MLCHVCPLVHLVQCIGQHILIVPYLNPRRSRSIAALSEFLDGVFRTLDTQDLRVRKNDSNTRMRRLGA